MDATRTENASPQNDAHLEKPAKHFAELFATHGLTGNDTIANSTEYSGYSGLIDLGASNVLNTLIQCLYMTPEIRDLFLNRCLFGNANNINPFSQLQQGSKDSKQADTDDNRESADYTKCFTYQLQCLLAMLQLSWPRVINPQLLFDATMSMVNPGTNIVRDSTIESLFPYFFSQFKHDIEKFIGDKDDGDDISINKDDVNDVKLSRLFESVKNVLTGIMFDFLEMI